MASSPFLHTGNICRGGAFSLTSRRLSAAGFRKRTDKHALACKKRRSGKRANSCRKRREHSVRTNKSTMFFEPRQVKTTTQTRKTAAGNTPRAIGGDFHHGNKRRNISANNGHNIVHASNSFLRSGGTLQSKFIAIKFNLYDDSAHLILMITEFSLAALPENKRAALNKSFG